MKKIKDIYHWLQHYFGLNTGRVVSWTDYDSENNIGKCYIGFRCCRCGQIDKKTVNLIEYKKDIDNE